MKRILNLLLLVSFLLFLSTAMADVEISETVFPDEGFRQYVIDSGFDGDGNGHLSREELEKTTLIDCHSLGIKSLQGIEYFTELQELRCFDNLLTELDVSKNEKLLSLSAYLNQLTKLDLTACKKLVSLSCSGNPISELLLPDARGLTWADFTWTNLQQLEIGNYPLLTALVQAGEPTPYIYGETEEQVNWVTDTSFLAVNRQCILKSGGKVLYGGAGTTEAPAERTDAAEATAESPENPEKARAAAEAAGKEKIARLYSPDRLYTPDFDGKYNTIWIRVPEGFSINNDGVSVSDEFAGYAASVSLKGKQGKDLSIFIVPLGSSEEWMGYGNLNEVPEGTMEEVIAHYIEHNHVSAEEPTEVEVYEFPGGSKMLRVLNSFETKSFKAFTGWTMHNGYGISVSFMISTQTGFRGPTDEEMQSLEEMLKSLEEIPD